MVVDGVVVFVRFVVYVLLVDDVDGVGGCYSVWWIGNLSGLIVLVNWWKVYLLVGVVGFVVFVCWLLFS